VLAVVEWRFPQCCGQRGARAGCELSARYLVCHDQKEPAFQGYWRRAGKDGDGGRDLATLQASGEGSGVGGTSLEASSDSAAH
jgi:hypothetical protein